MPAIHFNYCCRGAATPFRTSRSHRLPRAGLVKVSQRWALGGGFFFFFKFLFFLTAFCAFCGGFWAVILIIIIECVCVCDGTGNICRMITVCRPTLAASATCPRACRVPSFLKLAAEPHYKSHFFFFSREIFRVLQQPTREKRNMIYTPSLLIKSWWDMGEDFLRCFFFFLFKRGRKTEGRG